MVNSKFQDQQKYWSKLLNLFFRHYKKRKIEKIIPFFLGGAANIDYIRF